MPSAEALNVQIEIRLAWWWWPYFYGVVTMVHLTGMELDWNKLNAALLRAVWLRIGGERWSRLGDIAK